MFGWLSGLFLGWSLGANDTANCFGTAVTSRMVPWRRAALLAAFFVILGAVLQGSDGIETLRRLAPASARNAAIEALAAALTVALFTVLKQPVSSSHAIVGAVIGIGVAQRHLHFAGLNKIVLCWIGTPLGAMLFFVLFYGLLTRLSRAWRPSVFTLDPILRGGLVVVGCYAAYALGANNVANVALVFVNSESLTPRLAALLGGVTIAAGVLTFSRPVIMTVGLGITRLGSFEALVAVLATAVTTHIYALLGVPVSTSHAMVGAVLGLGLVQGLQVIRWRTLAQIGLAWVATPLLAAGLAMLFYYVEHLQFVP